ncbi:MAG: D-alanine--D-alanine ligase [Lachnospiraceae bacterium]|jgi:D-alanine-D-alanine ligase|nr:D-alanine--D-alanine ligase [Lachnospiraceae bacterium]
MKIVVLAGGLSPERDVSLASGKMIYSALKERGHAVILLDVYLGYEVDTAAVSTKKPVDSASLAALFSAAIDWAADITAVGDESPDIDVIRQKRDPALGYFGANVIALCQIADVVFIALHGENGEDGKIQACFDLMGITYTGSGYLGSALALDKALAKELFRHHSIPTPASFSLTKGEAAPLTMPLPFPVIVKTNNGGSSVGVTIVGGEDGYAAALEEAFRYDDEVLVEEYITGREFSVGIVAGKALPVMEISPLQGFFDYYNKYQPGATVETCPALLSADKTEELQALAEKVYAILRMESYARVDFMMNEDGQVFCIEGNTLPGMTPTSLLPQEAAAVGIDFASLCENIITEAMKKI